MSDKVQRVVSLGVGDGGVSIMIYEQVDDIKISVARRPLHWRGDEISALCVYLRTLLEQISTRSHMGIDCRPMERGNALVIAVGGTSLSRFYELLNETKVSPLSSYEDICLVAVISIVKGI